MDILFPDAYYNRIVDVPVMALKEMGIKGLLLDVDNTLTTHNNPNLSKEVVLWLEEAKEAGLSLIVFSNNTKDRATTFAEAIGLPCIYRGCKPLPFGYHRCLRALGLKKEEVAMIGDQIFTDILGGKLTKIYSILLEPIANEEMAFFKFKRNLEKKVLRAYEQKQTNMQLEG